MNAIEETCWHCGAKKGHSLDSMSLYGIPMSIWIDDQRVLKTILEVMNERNQDPDQWADLHRRAREIKEKQNE